MIQIKKVNTDNDLKEFIAFPYILYKNCKQYVPDMKQDMQNLVNPHKNPALSFCKYQLFLAYKENAVVGRVMAIINPRANETWHSKYVRFGYIDFIDDINNLASYKTIKELYDTINTLYNKSTGKNGTSENCYKQLIMFKEAKYR